MTKQAVTISSTKRVTILVKCRQNIRKTGNDILYQTLLGSSQKTDEIIDIIITEMIGSKNKYLVDLEQSKEDNKQYETGNCLLPNLRRILPYKGSQDLLEGGKRSHVVVCDDDWPLRGFVKCHECHSFLTSSTPTDRSGNRYPTYACPKY